MNVNKYHIYYWAANSTFFLAFDYIVYGSNFNLPRELFVIFINICVFYSFLFALVKYKKNNLFNTIASSLFLTLPLGLTFLLNYLRGLLAKFYGIELFKSKTIFVYDSVLYFMEFAFYAIGYYYATRYGAKQKELRQLAEAKAVQDVAAAQLAAQNAQMKQDMLELENNFLRAQINPHFLYNTLNTFYAKALPFNEELAYGIVTLSNIMRYSLESTESGQLLPLQMEVAQLERVIKMHRFRFGSQLSINFIAEGDMGELKVAPLVFVTLLENALKHGEAGDADNPISLWLSVDAKHIYFTIRNKKGEKRSGGSSGIGLMNINKRLTSVYGNHYKLDIEETADEYHVALVIEHGAGVDTLKASPIIDSEAK